MATYAISNGIGSLLLSSARKQLPAELQQSLQDAFFRTLARNTHIEQTILTLQSHFADANIPVRFIKGSILALTRYPDAAYRPMSDIDLIVPQTQVYNAFQRIQKLGATGQWRPLNETDHHAPTLVLGSTSIEVHTLLFPAYAKYAALNQAIWAPAYYWKKGAISLPGLSVAHHAFYIATHIYYNFKRGGLRLSWFYDLQMLQNDLSTLNKDELTQLTRHYQLEEPTTLVGLIYYCLTGNQLINWPAFGTSLPNHRTIEKIAASFRGNRQQDTNESYQLVMEQLQHAPTLKAKSRILLKRLTQHDQLSGWPLIKHLALVSKRFISFLLHQLRK